MQNADDARRKRPFETLADDDLVSLSSSIEKDIQKRTVFQEKRTEDIWNREDDMAMADVKHTFSKRIGALHVVEVTAGRTEAGFAGEGNPADLIATVTAIHGAVLWIPAVEDLLNFGNDDRPQM